MGEIRRRLAQDLVGLPQLAVLALQRLGALSKGLQGDGSQDPGIFEGSAPLHGHNSPILNRNGRPCHSQTPGAVRSGPMVMARLAAWTEEGRVCKRATPVGRPVLLFPAQALIWPGMAREKASADDVIPLLEGLAIGDLEKVIAAAERQREAKRESGKKELMEEFRSRAEALGLSLSDLAAEGTPKAGRPPGENPSAQSPTVKYRNPETGETWSGRGRAPKWLVLAEQQGRGREEFAAKG
jgi:DNA-binding protein H-NS